MNKEAVALGVMFALILVIGLISSVKADISPGPGYHTIQVNNEITNIADYLDYYFIVYPSGPGSDWNEEGINIVGSDGKIETPYYKFTQVDVYAVKKTDFESDNLAAMNYTQLADYLNSTKAKKVLSQIEHYKEDKISVNEKNNSHTVNLNGGRNDNETSCVQDSDCACGTHITTKDCFMGNKKYVNTTQQCPDFCTGIAGNFRIQCVDNKCTQVNMNQLCPENTDNENGKCYKNLSNGIRAEIKIMPDTASATAIAKLGDLGFTIELKEVGKGNDATVVYELTGNKEGKFLGIFKIIAKVQAQVDAEDGKVKIIKPWWAFLASGI